MKLHPLAAVREAGRRALLVGSSVLFFTTMAATTLHVGDVGLALLLTPVGALLGAVYGAAYHLRFSYELDGGTLAIQSGVLSRTDRAIPLQRVQNVDLRQSLLQRLLGLAVVRVETAGGGQTEAVLDFVSRGEAERLQRGIRSGTRTTTEPDEAGPAPSPLFELGDVELGLYALTSFRPRSVLVLLLAAPVGLGAAGNVLLQAAAPLGGPSSLAPSALASVAGVVLAFVGALLAVLTSIALSSLYTLVGYYGFALTRVEDDLVYERGLVRRYSGSIPLSKVQMLTVSEHVLARRLGYAGLRVETAGYSRGGDGGRGRGGSSRPDSAVPLATRERASSLARSIEPFGPLEFERPPKRARRRYAARYLAVVLLLTALLYGVGVLVGDLAYWPAPLLFLPFVPVAAHEKWVNRGYHVGPEHVAVRDGFWRRTTRIVPYDRLQTVDVRRTVFQRRLDLASLVVDTASSGSLVGAPAVAHDVETGTVRGLQGHLRERLSVLRASRFVPGSSPRNA